MKTKGALLTVILVLAAVSLSCNLLRTGPGQLPTPPPVEITPPPVETPAQVTEAPEQPTTAPSEAPPSPTETPAEPAFKPGPCEQDACIVSFQFPLKRPIAPP